MLMIVMIVIIMKNSLSKGVKTKVCQTQKSVSRNFPNDEKIQNIILNNSHQMKIEQQRDQIGHNDHLQVRKKYNVMPQSIRDRTTICLFVSNKRQCARFLGIS